MHCIQKYFENNSCKLSSTRRANNVLIYCNFYSFYSQKVLMALYEKNIDFDTYVIDITKGEQYSEWFLEMNPRGEIPVLKVNSQVIPDSTRILDYLEDHLNPELKPLVKISREPKVLQNINKFRELLEALPAGVITVGSFFHPHLCSATPKLPFIQPVREMLKNGDLGSAKNLRILAEKYPCAKGILLYKAEIQDRKHEILTDEDQYIKVLDIVDHVLCQVEQQLKSQGDGWLCCENFSLADINLAVLLQRLWELGLENRFWTHGKKPYIENYFYKVSQRESFKKTIPNITYHLKMMVSSQSPIYVGAAAVASFGVVISFLLVLKKIIK